LKFTSKACCKEEIRFMPTSELTLQGQETFFHLWRQNNIRFLFELTFCSKWLFVRTDFLFELTFCSNRLIVRKVFLFEKSFCSKILFVRAGFLYEMFELKFGVTTTDIFVRIELCSIKDMLKMIVGSKQLMFRTFFLEEQITNETNSCS
jgi:hypothetical protein